MDEKKNELFPEDNNVASSKKVIFLLLQYNNANITMNCISSILKMDQQQNIGIVIIDNNSPDNAGERLVDTMRDGNYVLVSEKKERDSIVHRFEYKSGCSIDIVCRNVNDGFSRGNNYGYRYVLNNYFTDFLVVSNNDVEFMQTDFIQLLADEYIRSKFDILGPDIWAPRMGTHQNPLSYSIPTLSAVNKTILMNQIAICFLPFIYPILRSRTETSKTRVEGFLERTENVCLQGSCLIYSAKYFDKRKQIALLEEEIQIGESLFYPETNFYYEEFLQTLWCQGHGCSMVYTPDIHVNHMEGQATNSVSKNDIEIMRFKVKNILESAKIYKKQLRSYLTKYNMLNDI